MALKIRVGPIHATLENKLSVFDREHQRHGGKTQLRVSDDRIDIYSPFLQQFDNGIKEFYPQVVSHTGKFFLASEAKTKE